MRDTFVLIAKEPYVGWHTPAGIGAKHVRLDLADDTDDVHLYVPSCHPLAKLEVGDELVVRTKREHNKLVGLACAAIAAAPAVAKAKRGKGKAKRWAGRKP